ncbi:hypothetical protein E4U61_001217 [Claviceps capensis]|nr:hypothetical protein E4U61_001217 [Claviceps capensis]
MKRPFANDLDKASIVADNLVLSDDGPILAFIPMMTQISLDVDLLDGITIVDARRSFLLLTGLQRKQWRCQSGQCDLKRAQGLPSWLKVSNVTDNLKYSFSWEERKSLVWVRHQPA